MRSKSYFNLVFWLLLPIPPGQILFECVEGFGVVWVEPNPLCMRHSSRHETHNNVAYLYLRDESSLCGTLAYGCHLPGG